MATIKSYTDIEQSKKLAKILPTESSDMYWDLLSKDKYAKVNNIGHCLCRTCVYAWSLSALLDILPKPKIYYSTDKTERWYCECWDKLGNYVGYTKADNPIDSCVNMIIKLHELKLL